MHMCESGSSIAPWLHPRYKHLSSSWGCLPFCSYFLSVAAPQSVINFEAKALTCLLQAVRWVVSMAILRFESGVLICSGCLGCQGWDIKMHLPWQGTDYQGVYSSCVHLWNRLVDVSWRMCQGLVGPWMWAWRGMTNRPVCPLGMSTRTSSCLYILPYIIIYERLATLSIYVHSILISWCDLLASLILPTDSQVITPSPLRLWNNRNALVSWSVPKNRKNGFVKLWGSNGSGPSAVSCKVGVGGEISPA